MDRRTQYRVDVGEDFEFRAELSAGTATIPVVPMDLSAEGVGIECDVRHPLLRLGDEVELRFKSNRSEQTIQLTARVMHRKATGDSTRYGLRFSDAPTFRAKLSPALLQLFNQRKAYRASIPLATPIPICIAPAGRNHTFRANLVDISTSGLGVRGPITLDAAMSAADRIGIRFRLPDAKPEIEMEGLIRHGRVKGDEVFYGIEFLCDIVAGHGEQDQAVVDYIMRRQRDELQHRADVARAAR